MTVKTGQAWAGTFVTLDATGAKASSTDAAGTLYVDGTANGASVTITGSNPYKWSCTLPSLTAGQRVDMYITATIATIATAGVVASEQADTALTSEVKADTAAILADTGTDGVVVASGQTVATVTNLTNLPTMPADWVTASGLKADAVTEIQSGLAKTTDIPSDYAKAGDAMTLTAAYDNAKDDVLTPLATVDNIVDAIKAKTDNLPASPAATGAAMTLTSAYDAAKTAATQASVNAIPTTPLLAANYTAPDNAGITTIKNKTNNLPAQPAAVGSQMTLADNAITNNKIASNAIVPDKIADSTIDKIQNGLVTLTSIFASFAKMTVSGAGTDELNGEYIEEGAYSDRPRYRLYDEGGVGTIVYLAWDSGYFGWVLTTFNPTINTPFYYSNEDVATPDLCETWTALVGDAPVPTVTSGGVVSLAKSSELTPILEAIEAIKGVGWTDETLKAIADAIALIPTSGGGMTPAELRAALGLALANLDAQLSGINSKTTNLPAVPAAKGDIPSVSEIATAVWGAVTRTLTALPTMAADWFTALGIKGDAVTKMQNGIAKTSELPTGYATEVNATSNKTAILDAIDDIDGGGEGATPAQIWSYETRTLTASPTDISNLPTKTDINTAKTDIQTDIGTAKGEVLSALGDIDIDTSDLAKQETLEDVKDQTDKLVFVGDKVKAEATVNLGESDIAKQSTSEQILAKFAETQIEIIGNVQDGKITATRGNDWELVIPCELPEGKIQMAVKNPANVRDDQSAFFVDSVDGLIYLDKDSADHTDGSLTYDGENLILTLNASATAQLTVGNYRYGIQSVSPAGKVAEKYQGEFIVYNDIVKATE